MLGSSKTQGRVSSPFPSDLTPVNCYYFYDLFFFMFMCECVPCICSACRGQKKLSDLLGLKSLALP